jgi:hypothetical protein
MCYCFVLGNVLGIDDDISLFMLGEEFVFSKDFDLIDVNSLEKNLCL